MDFPVGAAESLIGLVAEARTNSRERHVFGVLSLADGWAVFPGAPGS